MYTTLEISYIEQFSVSLQQLVLNKKIGENVDSLDI